MSCFSRPTLNLLFQGAASFLVVAALHLFSYCITATAIDSPPIFASSFRFLAACLAFLVIVLFH